MSEDLSDVEVWGLCRKCRQRVALLVAHTDHNWQRTVRVLRVSGSIYDEAGVLRAPLSGVGAQWEPWPAERFFIVHDGGKRHPCGARITLTNHALLARVDAAGRNDTRSIVL